MGWRLERGDCLAVLGERSDDSIDSIVTDPPAGIGFMNRSWDSNKGGREQWIDWMCERMHECYRVLKPGGHMLIWAIPRTSHWTATAIEDAGFEVRDVVTHHFGSGFPKSQNVGQFIDKLVGAERIAVGPSLRHGGGAVFAEGDSGFRSQKGIITAPATDEAKAWDGWGTALKPATEHWILARKPLSETSIARNVLKHGTGALNIDACRVERSEGDVPGWHTSGAKGSDGYQGEATFKIRDMSPEEVQERCGGKGRWPTNLLLSHSAGCQQAGTVSVKAHGSVSGKEPSAKTSGVYAAFDERQSWEAHGNGDGTETVAVWECAPGCPVAELDRQSGWSTGAGRKPTTPRAGAHWLPGGGSTGTQNGVRHEDSGGASRFFPTFRYQAKPSTAEKEKGLENLEWITVEAAWGSEVRKVTLLVDTAPSVPKVIAGCNGEDASGWNTLLFGSSTSVPSLWECTSITAMPTNSRIVSATLGWLTRSLTSGCIPDANSERVSGGSHAESAASSSLCLTITGDGTVSLPGVGPVVEPTRLTITPGGGKLHRTNPGGLENDPRWGPVERKCTHPTVKSKALMAWLITLVTRPGGCVLDPFCGSGSTGVAAVENGFSFFGIEENAEYYEIAEKRIQFAAATAAGQMTLEDLDVED